MTGQGRVLVSGQSGYIGSALVPALTAAGYDVVQHDPAPAHVHLAYNTAGDDYFTNIYSVAAAVEQAHPHDRFVFASTLNATFPRSAYEREKALAEKLVLARSDITPIILRLGCVYGPPMPRAARDIRARGVLNRLVRQAVRGQSPRLYGNVRGLRDYIYLSDVVQAFLVALQPETKAGTYDIGSGTCHTLEEAAKIACQEAGGGPPGSPLQNTVWPTVDPDDCYAEHYPMALETHWLPGWEPHVLLRDGLRHTVRWVRDQRQAAPVAQDAEEREAVPV